MSYVTLESVRFDEKFPSGQAFKATCDDGFQYVIPDFAVHDDSEIWVGSEPGEEGKMIIREDIAVEKGIVDPPTRSLGGGLPMKRHRLPDPPALLPDGYIEDSNAWLEACSGHEEGWSREPGTAEVYLGPVEKLHGDRCVAVFDDKKDAEFAARAPNIVRDLLKENARLREWVALAIKTQERRRRKK